MQRWSRGQARNRRRLRALIAVDGRADDALNKVAVLHARLGSRVGHVVTIADVWVGIGFENPDPSILADAEVQPGIIPQPESPIGGAAGLDDSVPYGFGQRAGEHVANPLPFSIRLVPLGRLGSDPLLRPGLPFVEHHFGDWKDLDAFIVSQNADVKLPSIYELLGDCPLPESLVDELHPLTEGGDVLHYRRLRDARRSIGLKRLDDEWKLEGRRLSDLLPEPITHETGHLNT